MLVGIYPWVCTTGTDFIVDKSIVLLAVDAYGSLILSYYRHDVLVWWDFNPLAALSLTIFRI